MNENITIKMVNLKLNMNLLKDIPHKILGDFLITYRNVTNITRDGIYSSLIRNEHMESLGMDANELHKIALKNTERLFPPRIGSMAQAIYDEYTSIEDFQFDNSTFIPMYSLTNEIKVHGANTILYPGLMNNLANKLGSNLYILPSSVHDVIILAANEDIDIRSLENMVRSVNEDQVEPFDRLSNQVYLYDKESKCIVRANDTGKDMNKEFVTFFFNQNSEDDIENSYDESELEP